MNEERPPYLHASSVAGAAFLLYLVTLAPTTWFWDTSEYIATAHILGIPHPPGNPLFVVVGKVWSLLLAPTGLSVAVRINIMAALTTAVATGFFFLLAYRVARGWLDQTRQAPAEEDGGRVSGRRLALIAAWSGSILAATAFTVWNQSNVNEKVYTLSVLVIAAVSWLAVLWLDRKDEPRSGWLLVLALYLMVLGSTNHLMSLLPAPAFLVMVLMEKPSVFMSRDLLLRGAAAIVIALSFNFFLPIRSAEQPIINEGEPVCESMAGAAVAIYSLGRAGCAPLAENLTREQYGKPPIFVDPTTANEEPRGLDILGHQYLNYFQYFDWQWARGLSASELPGNARLPFSLLFLGLGLWGLSLARVSHRGHFTYLTILAFTLTIALVFYLNFRYGYSLAPEGVAQAQREVRERDYFFIASFHLWGFLAGMGLVAAWRWAAGGSDGRSLALASPMLAVVFVPLIFNWSWADRSGDYSARDWAYNVLQSVEPYGILFTNGDNDTFPLWYLQEVEEIRQDVTVMVGQYLYTSWYPKQLRYHTDPERQRAFQDGDGLGLYEAPQSPPARPVTELSDDELDRIGFATLEESMSVSLGPITVEYPAGTQFPRGEQIALAIIRDSLGERPIHFASTAGLGRSLGLEDWLVRQGLTSRLRMDALEETSGVARVSESLGGEWIDLDLSLTLAQNVFRYRGFEGRAVWADRATLNIPWHFYFLYMQMADAAIRKDLPETLTEELLDRAEEFGVTAQGGHRGSP